MMWISKYEDEDDCYVEQYWHRLFRRLSYFLPEEVGKSCFTALYVLNGLSTLGYVLPQ